MILDDRNGNQRSWAIIRRLKARESDFQPPTLKSDRSVSLWVLNKVLVTRFLGCLCHHVYCRIFIIAKRCSFKSLCALVILISLRYTQFCFLFICKWCSFVERHFFSVFEVIHYSLILKWEAGMSERISSLGHSKGSSLNLNVLWYCKFHFAAIENSTN